VHRYVFIRAELLLQRAPVDASIVLATCPSCVRPSCPTLGSLGPRLVFQCAPCQTSVQSGDVTVVATWGVSRSALLKGLSGQSDRACSEGAIPTGVDAAADSGYRAGQLLVAVARGTCPQGESAHGPLGFESSAIDATRTSSVLRLPRGLLDVRRSRRSFSDRQGGMTMDPLTVALEHALVRWPRISRLGVGRYMRLCASASLDVLVQLLATMAPLRQEERVRSSLRAVAVLEYFETVVTDELERRLGHRGLQARTRGVAIRPWWEVACPRSTASLD